MRHRRRRHRQALSLISVAIALVAAWSQTSQKPALTIANTTAPAASSIEPAASPAAPNSSPAPSNLLTGAAAAVLNAQPGLAHVDHDVDGDTIDVTIGGKSETVRFIGIDTPETHDPRKPVQCFGEAAAAHTKALLEGKNVRLEPDSADSDRDKYGRLLRYVYLPDGTLVNAEIISDGYAFAYTVFPFTRLSEFQALEQAARSANRGLWAGCTIDDSKQIKQTTGAK